MRKDKLNLLFGILVLVIALSAIPEEIKNIILYICGALVAAIACVSLYWHSKASRPKEKSDIFVDSVPADYSADNGIADISDDSQNK